MELQRRRSVTPDPIVGSVSHELEISNDGEWYLETVNINASHEFFPELDNPILCAANGKASLIYFPYIWVVLNGLNTPPYFLLKFASETL